MDSMTRSRGAAPRPTQRRLRGGVAVSDGSGVRCPRPARGPTRSGRRVGGEIHNPGKVSIQRSGGIRGWYDVDKVERLTAVVVVVQGRSSPSRESLQGGTSALVGPCPLAPPHRGGPGPDPVGTVSRAPAPTGWRPRRARRRSGGRAWP